MQIENFTENLPHSKKDMMWTEDGLKILRCWFSNLDSYTCICCCIPVHVIYSDGKSGKPGHVIHALTWRDEVAVYLWYQYIILQLSYSVYCKSLAVEKYCGWFAGKLSQLDGDLAWPRPTAQAISLKKFCGNDWSTKTTKLFCLEWFAIYGIRILL